MSHVRSEVGESPKPPWYAGFLSGSIGGLAAGAVGHPLDTIKVMQQTRGYTFQEAISAAYRSPPLLLRGLGPALGVQLVQTALLFGVYDYLRNLFGPVQAGAMTGLALAPATCLLESLKCRAQVSSASGNLGLFATALRCGVGNAAFFGTYDVIGPVLGGAAAGGAAAGVAYWTVALPLDRIKSIQQVDGVSFLNALTRASWVGWSATMLRAIPMSAVCFQSAFFVNSWINKNNS